MPTSIGVVRTDAPARYANQLLSHLGHKVRVEDVDGVPDGGRLVAQTPASQLDARSTARRIAAATGRAP
jgi:hypothetical protein